MMPPTYHMQMLCLFILLRMLSEQELRSPSPTRRNASSSSKDGAKKNKTLLANADADSEKRRTKKIKLVEDHVMKGENEKDI